jgi:hypothetical protein
MNKKELSAQIARIYGVHPSKDSSYSELNRLRAMLFRHGKPKRSFLLAKTTTDTYVYDPPPFKPFKVEED